MDIAQKALYNSLRISWLQDSQISVEPWKVEDYRSLQQDELFSRLQLRDIFLDRHAYKSYAEQFDSPEEMTEWLIGGEEHSPEDYDQVYLVIFELWRRLNPEKPSISILCDELDLQMFKYDQDQEERKKEDLRALQDALSNLHTLLEENVDQGMAPIEVFSAISEFCANDIEHFLYDYIADQIDAQDYDYATELLDEFYPFVIDKRWFDLLKARLVNIQDLHLANKLIHQVFEANKEDSDPSLALNLDMLSLMVQGGNYDLFLQIVNHTLTLVEYEEDFIELLTVCSDFFRCLDQDETQEKIDALIAKRAHLEKSEPLSKEDPDVRAFKALLKA